jgi:hypothetical protein
MEYAAVKRIEAHDIIETIDAHFIIRIFGSP